MSSILRIVPVLRIYALISLHCECVCTITQTIVQFGILECIGVSITATVRFNWSSQYTMFKSTVVLISVPFEHSVLRESIL